MDLPERMRMLIKIEKETSGVMQGFIAGRCGYSQKDFSQLVNGYKPIKADDIEKFCVGMGIDPNTLYGWDEREHPALENENSDQRIG